MSQKMIYLKCEDYMVSKKKFELLYNSEFEMLETFPKPKEEELASYYESSGYISHTDSKKSFIDKLYQIVKIIALKNKLKIINSFKTTTKNILDVGCGTGDFLLNCKNNGWSTSGVEPNKSAKKLAETKLTTEGYVNLYSNINELNTKQFDVITLWHVLEHVSDLQEYILKLKLLLKSNGILVIAVPNYKSYDAFYYKQFWAAFDVPRHLWHFSRNAIRKLFLKQQMSVIKIIPMKFDSYYVSLLSEKHKYGKSNFFKAFYIGFISNLKALKSKEYSSLIYIIKNI